MHYFLVKARYLLSREGRAHSIWGPRAGWSSCRRQNPQPRIDKGAWVYFGPRLIGRVGRKGSVHRDSRHGPLQACHATTSRPIVGRWSRASSPAYPDTERTLPEPMGPTEEPKRPLMADTRLLAQKTYSCGDEALPQEAGAPRAVGKIERQGMTLTRDLLIATAVPANSCSLPTQ
ncbi:hypothetical protein S40293_11120 [Stachybotrys chartarum IBT 40293]|nr:hypothetical protein S40293_11120 [Stachybotrys chartarum IBT 40293]